MSAAIDNVDIDIIDPAMLVHLITGIVLPEKNNPEFNCTELTERKDEFTFSVSDLGADFQHLGGVVVFDESNPSYTAPDNYQIHRVVDYKNTGVLHYRLCKAADESPYEAYLVGWFYYTERNNHRARIQQEFNKAKILCKKN